MKGLHVSEEELKNLLVGQLEVLGEEEFDAACDMARRLRASVGQILVDRGRVPHGFLLEQLAQSWGVDYIDLRVADIKPQALRTLPEDFARANTLVPFELDGNRLRVAMCDPRNGSLIGEIKRKTRLEPAPYLAAAPAILRAQLLYKPHIRAMMRYGGVDGAATPENGAKPQPARIAPSELVNQLLDYAALTRCSDIHIEPYEVEGIVRFRIDGVLQEAMTLAADEVPGLVSRIKVMAGMRIDERRAPQDGRFEANLSGLKFDLRVSSLPTQWGEKLVLRALSKDFVSYDLEDLGLSASDYAILLSNLLRPYGMLLVTGPTGSGKSTSLYAMLTRLGAERKYAVNISTVEDPVEYALPRINQSAVNPTAGVTFPSALRALLRQDPDIVMVGEIRDLETAEIGVRAALVGRLLLSTLHTNDATAAVPRLIDMGIEPFLLASTLALVIGQRLVRRICTGCRESVPIDKSSLAMLRAGADFGRTIQALQQQGALPKSSDPLSGVRLFRGRGCAQCRGTGFHGRVGVFELFELNEEIRKMIMQRKDAASIRAAAVDTGMKTLFQDGLAKVFLGQTSLEEVARVAL